MTGHTRVNTHTQKGLHGEAIVTLRSTEWFVEKCHGNIVHPTMAKLIASRLVDIAFTRESLALTLQWWGFGDNIVAPIVRLLFD